jgi:hypothetical protein
MSPLASAAKAERSWRIGLEKYQASKAAKTRLTRLPASKGISGGSMPRSCGGGPMRPSGGGKAGGANPPPQGGGGGGACNCALSGESSHIPIPTPMTVVICASKKKIKNFQNNRPTRYSLINW